MDSRRLYPGPSHTLSLLIVASFTSLSLSEQLEVTATTHPVIGTVGSDVELSFRLIPAISAEDMEIEILRPPSTISLLSYWPGVELSGDQMQEYKGRAKLQNKYLRMGEVSVIIHDVVTSDNGTYRCLLTKNGSIWTDLDLLVTALGTDPVIEITDRLKEGFRAHCESNGWYPEPSILWKDGQGNALEPLSEQKHKNPSGLFTIRSSISVSSAFTASCSIRNILLDEERQLGVFISETLHQRVDHRGYIAIGMLVLLFILIFLSMVLNKSLQETKKVCNRELEKQRTRESEEDHDYKQKIAFTAESLKCKENPPQTCRRPGEITPKNPSEQPQKPRRTSRKKPMSHRSQHRPVAGKSRQADEPDTLKQRLAEVEDLE
uniref:Ig-like domain-containing protein n=1 Tax=Leptobrachium leishanense TaxID=445787 RepID=A0A8C5QXZ3_9ANUR